MNLDLNQFLTSKIQEEQLSKLLAIPNTSVHSFVAEAIKLCNPTSVFVCTDSEDDVSYIRQSALDLGEESRLSIEGHTIHYDGPLDQARDKPNTRFLSDVDLGEKISWTEKEAGKEEVINFLKNSMLGKEMIVRFFSLGPVGSDFSLLCLQITDSLYVAHSEDLLYRIAYRSFLKITEESSFFRFLHSAGELETNVTKNIPNRRIYIDLEDEVVYSVNNQYAGNSIGLKKLAFRLAIQKALREGWLAEHMFLMAIHGPNKRKTYFTGAFPSACGKTSTAMLTGQTIVGDDLAYLKKKNNQVYSVNVESGIFGIIRDVNAEDDPVIWDTLNEPNEVIFSNVLITDGKPYWLGDGREPPSQGKTFIGNWTKDTVDANNKPVPHAHKNARYTVSLYSLDNKDPEIDNKDGVLVKGIFFGGRDSDTSVPIIESFSWSHGVSIGASLESETTAATLGAEGVRSFNPMSILDFLSVPIGKYLEAYFAFEKGLPAPPTIFGTNYFLKNKDGKYITGMQDKLIWVLWSELRVHGEVEAIETPIGFIPHYDDLKRLF
ncbi:MAG: phosphoenolpyruvate carboxykinase (GTP), partial [Candidatus Kariarchaeaceae archaeon]